MKKLFISVFIICAFLMCSACVNQPANNTLNLNNNEVEENTNQNNEQSVLDGETFEQLPNEAINSFNYVTDCAKKLYPDAQGEWMYGYKGVSKVGKSNCYVFALYTYKDKTHTKVGTVAKSIKGDIIYMQNELTGSYSQVEIPNETKSSWAQTTTLAFAKSN